PSARPPGCRDQLAGDRPGLIRGQEYCDERDLRGVHHAADGIAARSPERQDHYIARMCCEVRGIETLIETLNERGRGLAFASELWRYVTTGTGMLTYSASLCAASVKVLEESATQDVQCVFAPASYKPGLIRVLDDKTGITGDRGRCGHYRAAMCSSVRPTRASSRRS